jgi:hypothetical protein
MPTLIFIVCALFLLGCFCYVFICYNNNPYIGSTFFVDADAGKDSPLYISKSVVVDGRGRPILKFKRVSCVPGYTYTQAVSDWFYNVFENAPLINLVQISEEKANDIYKNQRKYTNQIAVT